MAIQKKGCDFFLLNEVRGCCIVVLTRTHPLLPPSHPVHLHSKLTWRAICDVLISLYTDTESGWGHNTWLIFILFLSPFSSFSFLHNVTALDITLLTSSSCLQHCFNESPLMMLMMMMMAATAAAGMAAIFIIVFSEPFFKPRRLCHDDDIRRWGWTLFTVGAADALASRRENLNRNRQVICSW